MKKIIYSCLLFLFCLSANGQDLDSLYADKVKTLDSTIETLYAVISGDAGVKRDWKLFRYLFKPEARLMPAQALPENLIDVFFLSPSDYKDRSGAYLETKGFHEVETHRITEEYGNIAHVFSTYAAYQSKKDETPFMTGINSIQLFYDNNRWWILNVYWQAASDKVVIPERYQMK